MDGVTAFPGGTQGLPHGVGLLWDGSLVWLHMVSDALIALAYYAILVALVYYVRHRRDVAFHWVFLLFGAFIFACGTAHLMSIWTLWQPVYGLEGLIKAVTAGVSVITAMMLVPLIPKALALPSLAQLETASRTLQDEIAERQRAEASLCTLTNTLEQRVEERTAALTQANLALEAEMAERRRTEEDMARLNRELQRHITEFQTLLDVLPIGIAVAEDPECQRVWANSWLSNLLGVAPGDNVSPGSRPPAAVPYRFFREGQEVPVAERPMQYAAIHGEEVRDVEVDLLYDDGRSVRLLGYASPLFDEAGQVRGCLGTYVDITERRQMEAQLRAALHEKETLLREIHHRVKNNLQVVSSLLDLQAETVDDPRVRLVFEESQHRIQAMALIHESLYQSDELTHIDAAAYIQSLSRRLLEASSSSESGIRLALEIEPVMLPPQTAIPCGLILNELLTNALKHAFPGDQMGTISIVLRREGPARCVLSVRDTGVGFPAGLDLHATDSLGLQLVCLLTEQLGGAIDLERGGGTVFTITFPL